MQDLDIRTYREFGKLPNPFIFDDGTEVKSAEDWEKRREELIRTAVELQYGTMPPEPEFVEVKLMQGGGPGGETHYRITTGTKEFPVVFYVTLYKPYTKEKCPVIITGDGCYHTKWTKELTQMFTDAGIILAVFNRDEIVPDVRKAPRDEMLHKAYPDKTFGGIAAWAWGYLRTTDALLKLGIVDEEHIIYTGLSRGGKATLVAGALDKRAWLVNPEAPCAGGSLYRSATESYIDQGNWCRSEELKDLATTFPDWLSPEMQNYVDCPEKLPFDEHELKALVAPRIYFDSEARSDIWAGPVQAMQSNLAAKEVYKFLGAEDNFYWYFREGFHGQTPEDFGMLLNLILYKLGRAPLSERFNDRFFEVPSIFDWSAPEA